MKWPILQRINSVEEMHFGPAITRDNHGLSERRLEVQQRLKRGGIAQYMYVCNAISQGEP